MFVISISLLIISGNADEIVQGFHAFTQGIMFKSSQAVSAEIRTQLNGSVFSAITFIIYLDVKSIFFLFLEIFREILVMSIKINQTLRLLLKWRPWVMI